LAAGLLLLLPGKYRVAREGSSTIRADIAEGIRLLWRNRVLRSIAVMTGVFNLASSASVAVLVLYAVGDSSALGLTEAQYGLLFSITAAGSVLGTLVVSGVERRLGRSRTLAVGLVLAAVFVGIPGLTTEPLVVAVGFFLGGVGLVLWNVVAVSLRQRVTPDALLGRITGVHRLFAWGSMPLGAVLGGAIGEWLGVRAVFGIMAVLVLGLLALMRNFGEDILAAAEQDS
jgi:MFS family permease